MKSKSILRGTSFYFYFLNLYILLKAFYFFPSGKVQLADVLMCLLIIFYFIHTPVKYGLLLNYNKYLFFFFLVIVIVNLLYFFFEVSIERAYSYVYPIAFYGFNILIYVFCSELFKKGNTNFFLFLAYTIALAMFIMAVMFILGFDKGIENDFRGRIYFCLLYTSPSPRDLSTSRMPSSA